MSETEHESPEGTIPPADFQVCFHGIEVFGATTTTGKDVLALRLHGHAVNEPEGAIQTFEFVADGGEVTEILVALLSGAEALAVRANETTESGPTPVHPTYGSMN